MYKTKLQIGLLIAVIFTAIQFTAAQTVIPSVCVESGNPQTGTTTLIANAAVGDFVINVSSPVPLFAALVINPGGANEETALAASLNSPASLDVFVNRSGIGATLTKAHTAGEIVQFVYDGATAYFGYNNTSGSVQTFGYGILTQNYFTRGSQQYGGYGEPVNFQPGIHQRVFALNVPPPQYDVKWVLNNNSVAFNRNSPRCAVITYQGKLSNAGAAASGNYDLRFTLFDAAIGGAAQGDAVTANNVAVTNGIFTTQLNFGSALFNNNTARFLEIAVRPASANQSDPYTTLSPRQPVTDVPYAVNAQKAFSVSGGFVQLPLTTSAPAPVDCILTTQYGQTLVDAVNNKLYVCMATGWKAFVPQ